MDENLQLQLGLRADAAEVVERQLPGEHHAADAQPLGQGHAFGAGDRHLRGGVQGKIGRDRADQPRRAEILHDGRVNAGGNHRPNRLLQQVQFAGKDERVEGHEAADAAEVQVGHELRQFFQGEVRGLGPRVQSHAEAEVDGIGAVFHGRAGTVEIAGGGKEFGRDGS